MAERQLIILNGPNLNLLGSREPEIYGRETLDEIIAGLRAAFAGRATLEATQSNHEGLIIDALHAARERCDGVILNPGGWTHTSVSLRDAVSAVALPTVEVHLSLPEAREAFRHTSLIAPVCVARVAGFGGLGYRLAVEGLLGWLDRRDAALSAGG